MKIREARIADVEAINALLNYYAELDKMLFRSIEEIYEDLQAFCVAEVDGAIVGCCSLEIVWAELAEIKSLAIDVKNSGKGIGSDLVKAALERAGELGLKKVFVLTLEEDFFSKLGFKKIKKKHLPMKVWSDCVRCSKQPCCDEIAMVLEL